MDRKAMRPRSRFVGCCVALIFILAAAPASCGRVLPDTPVSCTDATTVTAHVVALNRAIQYNRLGANLPNGKMFALAGDVFPQKICSAGTAKACSTNADCTSGTCQSLAPSQETSANSCRNLSGGCLAGAVQLRSSKRPRPLVLRVNEAQCLTVTFTNLLAASDPNTDYASVHVQGLEWLTGSSDDGSFFGNNPDSLAAPGQTKVYNLFPSHEGDWVLYSQGDAWSAVVVEGSQIAFGLFGALNVQPRGAEYYRSQLTEQDLCWASADKQGTYPSPCTRTGSGPPRIDYRAVYPAGHPQAGLPILNMVNCAGQATQGCPGGGELVHSDLTAVITGRDPVTGLPGNFPPTDASPVFNPAYSLPQRHQPYREITIVYHEVMGMTQAFPDVYNNIFNGNGNGADLFALNYGSAGIGSEIIANRLKVGPEGDCTSCKYEEFFLSSWVVGDPAMVVDKPSTGSCTPVGTCSTSGVACDPDGSNTCGTEETCGFITYTCNEDPPTRVFYPDDPSNVYHSYIGDHTKFRVLHGGVDLHHLHHQHAHQWLHSPDTPTGDYTDSQSIGPGSSFTMEMVYNGSGNVNQTVGDSIFHCHFYPHFAMGMWSLWRVHDVLETGTELAGGQPTATARALPDGEIVTGTPIPAVVPIPTRPMAPLPGEVRLTDGGTGISVCKAGGTDCVPNTQAGTPSGYDNPGYPFFIPALAGQRPAHPPMDFAYACSDNNQSCNPGFAEAGVAPNLSACGAGATCEPLNGGLPRHIVQGGGTTSYLPLDSNNATSKVDLSKILENVSAFQLPEGGTLAEQIGMQAHSRRFHGTCLPDGTCAPCLGSVTCATACNVTTPPVPGSGCYPFFTLNGLPPQPGAPYADPCINFSAAGGVPAGLETRHYKAVDVQLDTVFNKEGWHYPQQRIISLWDDVAATLDGTRAPEPLFFRVNSRDCVDYALANLVPNVYELDDFQVRTPTDILGQHIHLVKFDVTSSDGAANGWNYEDGTFAPNEVTERIAAINEGGGLSASATAGSPQTKLTAKSIPFFGPGPGGQWVGSQATLQRWYADPLFDGGTNPPETGARDRTLRTVFTHDHFSPSTHQQTGLYAGLVVEPTGSTWSFNTGTGDPFGGAGQPLNGRLATGYDGTTTHDGGPTSWQAVIASGTGGADSFREFLFQIQDSTLTYQPFDHVQAPSQMAQGFCSDSFASCTPATIHNFEQAVTGCNPGATCFGYGFCSDNKQKCAPDSALNVACGGCNGTSGNCNNNPAKSCTDPALAACATANARCNLVPGIPGTNVASGGSPAVAFWGTTPIDAPGIGPGAPSATPEIITLTGATFNFSVNYRNEPLFPRIKSSPVSLKSLTRTERLAAVAVDETTDLSWAYTSIARPNLAYDWCNFAGQTPGGVSVYPCKCTDTGTLCTANSQCSAQALCSPYPALTPGVLPGDPFTPLLRGYAGDDVQVRILVGAHINPHNFMMHGLSWLMEPSMVDSGWRNNQVMGISEHFEMLFPLPPFTSSASFPGIGTTPRADYLYMGGAAAAEQSQGHWGLVRAYGDTQSDLPRLPNNPDGHTPQVSVCPSGGTTRFYVVVATTAQQALGGPLVYNSRPTPLEDPNALLYVDVRNLVAGGGGPCDSDFKSCKLADPSAVAPLVLRANAGDCISVTLYNAIDTSHVGPGASNPINTAEPSNTSTAVGLHPQLVNFDVTQSNGFNIGTNPDQTVAAISSGDTPSCTATTFPAAGVNCTTYTWYAGNVDPTASTVAGQYIPIEFGAANLLATDVLNHYSYGLFGALIIEPAGSQWPATAGTSAQIKAANGTDLLFNEFVVIFQDGLPLLNSAARPAPLLTNPGNEMDAVNYKTEFLYQPYGSNLQVRSCGDPAQPVTGTGGRTEAVSCALSSATSPTPVAVCCTQWDPNSSACTQAEACRAPQTPTFTACAGEPVRFRVLHGGGVNTDQVFELAGHNWAETPYMSSGLGCVSPTTQTNLQSSSVIGDRHLCTPVQLARQQSLFGGAKVLAAFGDDPDSLSDWQGSRMGHGPGHHFDVVIDSAGGVNAVPGDYFYRSYPAMHFNLGPWGIFRVTACGGS